MLKVGDKVKASQFFKDKHPEDEYEYGTMTIVLIDDSVWPIVTKISEGAWAGSDGAWTEEELELVSD